MDDGIRVIAEKANGTFDKRFYDTMQALVSNLPPTVKFEMEHLMQDFTDDSDLVDLDQSDLVTSHRYNVRECVVCKGTHTRLVINRLRHPRTTQYGAVLEHWIRCPDTQQPVFFNSLEGGNCEIVS